MPDQLSALYSEFLEGGYDCVDRVVCNAYFSMGQSGGGFRMWWRELYGSDENLDNNHLMRMAGRFSRRLRAWAEANHVPVEYCAPKVRKHEIAEEQLSPARMKPGLFLILISKAPALVWEAQQTASGKLGQLVPKDPWPYVNHYSFHIWDPDWGHITIKMSGHPPFGAQVILNGHEFVAAQAQKVGVKFTKQENCFTAASQATELTKIADTLSEKRLQGDCANSGNVGFTALACVSRWTWKNRKRAHFNISTRCFRWSTAGICGSVPAGRWMRFSNR